jgi:hypothetical protein
MQRFTRILFSIWMPWLMTFWRARGVGVPASDRAGVWGEAPRKTVMRLALRMLKVLHNGGAHGAPARERRGVSGSPRATEPGCGAEPHVI